MTPADVIYMWNGKNLNHKRPTKIGSFVFLLDLKCLRK